MPDTTEIEGLLRSSWIIRSSSSSGMFHALLRPKTLHIFENEMKEVAMFIIIIGKEYRLSWATFAEASGRGLCGLILGLVLCMEDAAATTYYLSATGNDASAGTVNAPWKTFNYAMFLTSCGDTLMLKDGEYTTAIHGSLNIKKSCTANTPFIVQAQNQRKAHLKGDGSVDVLTIVASAYVIVDGLRITSADNSAAISNYVNVLVSDGSKNITLRNLLVSHNNRYRNTPLIRFGAVSNNLIEDSEMYYWHRHGLSFSAGASHNIARRVYGNSRRYGDIEGGFPSGIKDKGDSAFSTYPGSNNTFENCISEGNGIGFDIESSQVGSTNNKYYGDISFNDQFGFLFKARSGSTEVNQPRHTIIENGVAITPITAGVYSRGNIDTQCDNCTFYGGGIGFMADYEAAYPGSGFYSVFGTNVLAAFNNKGTLILKQSEWAFTNINVYGNKTDFSPVRTVQNYVKPTVIDPLLGSCRVWIPDDSPMKGAGKNGTDIGANILYRYQNGELTTVPLWNRLTGEFPHGALVVGANDIPGESLFDVHKRLNVNTNGCLFPKGYAQGSDTSSPRAPQGLAAR